MKILSWNALDSSARSSSLARPRERSNAALRQSVQDIVDDVASRGWAAAADHALRLDGAAPCLVEVADQAETARRSLSREQLAAFEMAAANIKAFHQGSLPPEHAVETRPGLTVRKVWRALDRVGIYVPGGETPLFSTLLMLALPARAAGVRELVTVTPPRRDGSLDPLVALAAELCGIPAIWTIGGAQAIAAMAFGSGEIPAVAKICGPGNIWVAEAKNYVASLPGGPAIDMPAGPSELMIVADDRADPDTVAADLLSQAEHDPAAQVLLVTTSPVLAARVADALRERLPGLPRRAIAETALGQGAIMIAADLDQAIEIANLYAPEHLSLAVESPEALLPLVRNAGAVFAGRCAAETFGDYLAGSSHVLPTDGAARAWSGVSVHTFLRSMTIQTVTDEAASQIAAPAAALARLEGLEAHARAADARRSEVCG